ncbi:MAG: Gfo/Idh/MocA family oxidoreductase [Lentisphaerae bacterium]|nr:Gfo/Idh/MocA family oxidoreductase [Lentisphaerota bacterium]
MINIAVVGFGYWGPNLVRNFSQLEHCTVKSIVETNAGRRSTAQKLYPQIPTMPSFDAVISDPHIDAIVLAVPVSAHFPLAKAALLGGKHVLLEKPMTDSAEHARELIDLAQRQQKVLMVDHTFLYTGAIKKIKELTSKGEIGEMQYFDSVRINLGLFQHDSNVLWDLAAHDISMLEYLEAEPIQSVVATGISHTPNRIENIAYLTAYYQSNKIAHFTLSWTSPVKIRKILIGGTRKMLVYDDLEPTEKVKVYDTGFSMNSEDSTNSYEERNKILVDYRVGDAYIPKIEMGEALRGMAADFIRSIREGTEPTANAQSGLSVVRILEAADRSLRNRGQEVMLT